MAPVLHIDQTRPVPLRAGKLARDAPGRSGRLTTKPRLVAAAPAERLSLALGHFEHGVALWNVQEHLVLANDQLADIFGLPEQFLVVGLAFREFLVHAAESGCLEGRDPDGIYELTMSLVHAGKPVSFEDQLSSGRVVRVSYRPFTDGGWLAVYED